MSNTNPTLGYTDIILKALKVLLTSAPTKKALAAWSIRVGVGGAPRIWATMPAASSGPAARVEAVDLFAPVESTLYTDVGVVKVREPPVNPRAAGLNRWRVALSPMPIDGLRSAPAIRAVARDTD